MEQSCGFGGGAGGGGGLSGGGGLKLFKYCLQTITTLIDSRIDL
jgi:hypothetical protein